jgi:hypothetical protein
MDRNTEYEIFYYRITKESDITPEMIAHFSALYKNWSGKNNNIWANNYDPRELRNYFLDNCKEEK